MPMIARHAIGSPQHNFTQSRSNILNEDSSHRSSFLVLITDWESGPMVALAPVMKSCILGTGQVCRHHGLGQNIA